MFVFLAKCPDDVEAGELVCALDASGSMWYRAEVVTVDGENITVYFVDYGNYECVLRKNIREFTADLTKLPALCVKVELSRISRSDVSVRKNLMNLVSESSPLFMISQGKELLKFEIYSFKERQLLNDYLGSSVSKETKCLKSPENLPTMKCCPPKTVRFKVIDQLAVPLPADINSSLSSEVPRDKQTELVNASLLSVKPACEESSSLLQVCSSLEPSSPVLPSTPVQPSTLVLPSTPVHPSTHVHQSTPMPSLHQPLTQMQSSTSTSVQLSTPVHTPAQSFTSMHSSSTIPVQSTAHVEPLASVQPSTPMQPSTKVYPSASVQPSMPSLPSICVQPSTPVTSTTLEEQSTSALPSSTTPQLSAPVCLPISVSEDDVAGEEKGNSNTPTKLPDLPESFSRAGLSGELMSFFQLKGMTM